jgi:DNA-binding MarR family transcriptional regulator
MMTRHCHIDLSQDDDAPACAPPEVPISSLPIELKRCCTMVGMARKTRIAAARGRPELAALFDETVALYLGLTASAAAFYGLGDISGPRRSVLAALARSPPQTVAQLARARAQSRQRLQPLVNALRDQGLLELRENPAHRHSPLLVLTRRGEHAVREINATEAYYRERLRVSYSPRAIASATAVLRQVREAVEEQRRALRSGRPVPV